MQVQNGQSSDMKTQIKEAQAKYVNKIDKLTSAKSSACLQN